MSSTPVFTKDEMSKFWSDACLQHGFEYPKKGSVEHETVLATFKDILRIEKFYRMPDGLKKWTVACHRLRLDPRIVKKGQPEHTRVLEIFKKLTPQESKICPY